MVVVVAVVALAGVDVEQADILETVVLVDIALMLLETELAAVVAAEAV